MPSLIHLQFTFLQYSEDQCWKQQEGLHQSKGKQGPLVKPPHLSVTKSWLLMWDYTMTTKTTNCYQDNNAFLNTALC